MSVTFSTGFHTIKPGLRVSGDEISVVFLYTYDTGIYAGKKYIHIDLTNESDLTFVEAGVSGPLETVPDVDALYTQLKDAGMTEVFDGFLVDPSDLSSIQIGAQQISFDFAGHQPYVFSRNPDANVTERTKVSHQTWSIPQADFAGAVALFTNVESPEEVEFQSIEARLNLEASQLDALIASGMWLFPTQADFPPAADNHGRVVHSHADGAIFFAHAGTWNQVANEADLQTAIASLANEASTRETADNALSGRLDVLEADPTTAAAVAAGDAATLSSANTYTDTKVSEVIGTAPGILDTLGEIADSINDDANVYTTLVSQINAVQTDVDSNEADSDAADAALSGRLDVLEADPTTQALLDQESADRVSGDNALNTRLVSLEADPTTATALAAVQSDVDQNESDSDAADAALSGRLDVLEADPTTQALLDAETAARIAGDAALREEIFPPACTVREMTANLVSVDSAGGNTPVGSNTYTDTEFGWEDSATWTHYLWISNNLRGSGADRFPYGDGTLPPQSKITINGVRYDVTEYDNVSGYSYFEVTADLSSLVGTELTIGWCIPEVYAPIENPDFEGQVDIDTNARIEFADNLTKIHNVLRGTSINIGNNIEMKPAAAGGRVEITGDLIIDASDFVDAANDTAAAAAGVVVGQVYRNGSDLKVRIS